MYESPIDIIYNDIQYKVVEEFDKNVVSAVQSYGIDVNKEELLKALRYDRQQYEKGYADAKAELRWIPCSERLPEKFRRVLCTIQDGEQLYVSLGAFIRHTDAPGNPDFRVVAWMPLPEEPYKEEE